jgi:hypothetical protein
MSVVPGIFCAPQQKHARCSVCKIKSNDALCTHKSHPACSRGTNPPWNVAHRWWMLAGFRAQSLQHSTPGSCAACNHLWTQPHPTCVFQCISEAIKNRQNHALCEWQQQCLLLVTLAQEMSIQTGSLVSRQANSTKGRTMGLQGCLGRASMRLATTTEASRRVLIIV